METKTKAKLLLVILIFMLPSFSFGMTYDVRCMNKTHAICCGEKCLWTCQFDINEEAKCTADKNGHMKCLSLHVDKAGIVGPENFCLNLKFKHRDNCLITRDERKTTDPISTFTAICKGGLTALCCNQTCNWSAPSNVKCNLTLKNATCNETGCQEGKSFISDVKQCGFKEEISKGVTCTITEADSKDGEYKSVDSKEDGEDKSVDSKEDGEYKRVDSKEDGEDKSGLVCLTVGGVVGAALAAAVVGAALAAAARGPVAKVVKLVSQFCGNPESKEKGSDPMPTKNEGEDKHDDNKREGGDKSGTANKPGESSALLECSDLRENQNPHRRSPRK